jgi:hypothetical protein
VVWTFPPYGEIKEADKKLKTKDAKMPKAKGGFQWQYQ